MDKLKSKPAFSFMSIAKKRIENGCCPLCNRPISLQEFRSLLDYKEYRISGMCQVCQDKVFAK